MMVSTELIVPTVRNVDLGAEKFKPKTIPEKILKTDC
jgi:hypothetical protein